MSKPECHLWSSCRCKHESKNSYINQYYAVKNSVLHIWLVWAINKSSTKQIEACRRPSSEASFGTSLYFKDWARPNPGLFRLFQTFWDFGIRTKFICFLITPGQFYGWKIPLEDQRYSWMNDNLHKPLEDVKWKCD